jgi:hypothetical protein
MDDALDYEEGSCIKMRIKEIITEYVTPTDLHRIEQKVNRLWDEDDIEINLHQRSNTHDLGHSHFLQRANDDRNVPEIDADEIENVFIGSHEFGRARGQIKKVRPGDEAVINDQSSEINIPFMMKSPSKSRNDPEGIKKEIVPKTIMRKNNFKSYAPKIVLPTKPAFKLPPKNDTKPSLDLTTKPKDAIIKDKPEVKPYNKYDDRPVHKPKRYDNPVDKQHDKFKVQRNG